jgi:hypothetical protein
VRRIGRHLDRPEAKEPLMPPDSPPRRRHRALGRRRASRPAGDLAAIGTRLIAIGAMTATLAAAAPAAAITNSTPDGNGHPYVGQFVGDFDRSHPGLEPGCAGTLISPTVFLTGAHCIAHRPDRQAARLFVNLSSEWAYPGSPAPSDLHPVVAYHYDPGFDEERDPLGVDDLAVLILDPAVADVAAARLPAAGALQALAAHGDVAGAPFDSIGYGFQGIARADGPPQLI